MRLVLAATAVGLLAAPARADILTPSLGQPVTEVSHSVDITVADGVATYKVQRVFANAGTRADEAGLEIDLPPGAAATGLRIRARDRWYDGELMAADKAAVMYREMTGMGAHEAKDPALLQWMWADKLYLQVFPVLPDATSTVEYTLTVPTHYEHGQYFLSYPRLAAGAAGLAQPVVTIHPAWGDATTRIVVDGARVVDRAPVVLAMPVVPDWLAAIDPDPSASYASSTITMPDVAATRGTFAAATVTLDIDHTYKSDLRVDLMTPAGTVVPVFDGSGGSANDVRGTFAVALPAGTKATGTWRLIVSDHAARDTGTVDEWKLALGPAKTAHVETSTDTPVFVPDAPESANDAGLATIIVAPPAIDVATARLGTVVASGEHAFSRLELDVAPELSKLPKRAQVVFVIDASYSQGDDGIAAQLAIVRAYVAHVPDADVELVAYRRTAARVFGAFVPAAELDARIAKATAAGAFAPGNGSALDAGAALAVEVLDGRKGPLRIVVATDQLVRSTLTQAVGLAALAKAPKATIVHVVVPLLAGDEVVVARDDDSELAPLATRHHGILANISGLPAKTDKLLTAAMLGLVRPIRIDHVSITGLADRDAADVDTLAEGDGVRAVVPSTAAHVATKVVVTGALWSDPYKQVVKPGTGFSRDTAAFVFSEDDHHDLSDAEMMTVATTGKVVSPVTSYLATEPGVRPSPIGIPGRGQMMGRAAGAPMVRIGSAMVAEKRPELIDLVADAAKACVAEHAPAAGWSVIVEAETTRDEIVDATTTTTSALATCLVEAVWATRLTAKFNRSHDHYTLEFK